MKAAQFDGGARGQKSALALGARDPLILVASLGDAEVAELLQRGLAVSVLKRRLNWAAERRALFGALLDDAPDGLPPAVRRRLRRPAEG